MALGEPMYRYYYIITWDYSGPELDAFYESKCPEVDTIVEYELHKAIDSDYVDTIEEELEIIKRMKLRSRFCTGSLKVVRTEKRFTRDEWQQFLINTWKADPESKWLK